VQLFSPHIVEEEAGLAPARLREMITTNGLSAITLEVEVARSQWKSVDAITFDPFTASALESIQCQACGTCFGDEFFVLIASVAFHVAKVPSSMHDQRCAASRRTRLTFFARRGVSLKGFLRNPTKVGIIRPRVAQPLDFVFEGFSARRVRAEAARPLR
jgi:hypothetical protein